MRILMTVQGEGRGHMTQALAVRQWCQRHGHQIVSVLAGKNPIRSWPDFFEDGFDQPVQPVESPGFALSKGKGVHLGATIWQVLKRHSAYRKSIASIDKAVLETRPDVILNFLEPLVGLRSLFRKGSVPVVAIGHQFMLRHPSLKKTSKKLAEQIGLRGYVGLTGAGASKYALSFYDAPDIASKSLFVGPPLLRDGLFALKPTQGKHLLIYLLNAGYREEVEQWHASRPEVPIHCFYDRQGAAEVEEVDSTLSFHKLHGEKFLDMMTSCRGVVCTAGFESVSEAAWLGKPLLAVPVQNHVEQYLNALDAQEHRLAIASERFHLDLLMEFKVGATQAAFQQWAKKSDDCLSRCLSSVIASSGA